MKEMAPLSLNLALATAAHYKLKPEMARRIMREVGAAVAGWREATGALRCFEEFHRADGIRLRTRRSQASNQLICSGRAGKLFVLRREGAERIRWPRTGLSCRGRRRPSATLRGKMMSSLTSTKEPPVETIVRIGLDTSKSVFQLHGVDCTEQPVLRRKLRRGQVLEFFRRLPPALVALEACGASHYWARELQSLGHQVVIIPPQYVKPYVQRGKSDAADAEAICEAASRPKLRKNFVPIKSPEQQGAQMLARVRNQFIGRRTQLANSIRGYAAEFGFTAPKGLSRLVPNK